ncbi:Rap1a/Tai family immunity protein [Loktanella sp. 3ANDIMAR09]|uniref:Rap1a/Tai family immunity protein n=1 Tax=Loktanella sp. 3ANDIMAR09 TaxID=1225657 RepID=UPI0006FF6086|nr:Rap1a/Tai family immunity protein [Loktanella sp. 3ANDIMAR09]
MTVPSHGATQELVTGNDILNACRTMSDSIAVEAGFCVGHIIGTWEGAKFGAASVLSAAMPEATASELESAVNNFLNVCLPLEFESGQMVDLFMVRLEERPASRHESARSLLVAMLSETYPCV